MTTYNNITEAFGNTPLVKLNGIAKDLPGEIYAKLESFNPGSSVKDRLGIAIIDAAEKSGKLRPGGTIIEATSGNTGIALAWVGAAKGYRVILAMPSSMSSERKAILRFFGAELHLTEPSKGMAGAKEEALKLSLNTPGAILARQFENQANREIHRRTTAEEIWSDTSGEVDFFVAGIGTGGTITGVGEVLKERNSEIKIIAVEPADSPLLTKGTAGPHKIQGIGANFVPDILNEEIIDEIYDVSLEDSIKNTQKLAQKDGILAGLSSGAALTAALAIAEKSENSGKKIVVILPDTGERYVSTFLFDDFRD